MNKILLGVVAFLLLMMAKCQYDHNRRLEGIDSEHKKKLDQQSRNFERAKDSINNQLRHDTTFLTRTIVQRIPVVKEVEKLVLAGEPVPAIKVKELIDVDNQVISDCKVALETAISGIVVRDPIISNRDEQVELWKRRSSPKLTTKIANAVKWGTVGAILVKVFSP